MRTNVHGIGYGSVQEWYACTSVGWDFIPHEANFREFKRLSAGRVDIVRYPARALTRDEIDALYPGRILR